MKLKNKAQQMAEVYQNNHKVAGILLAGSVSRGWEDSHSDIELHILWNEAPNEEDRMTPILEAEGEVFDFFPFEEEEWAETYISSGVKFEISSFLVKTIEGVLNEVIEKANLNYDLQCLVASVQDGVILFERDSVLTQLKKRVNEYPAALGEQMVTENLYLGSRWNNRRALLHRQDWIMYYDLLNAVQKKLLGVLFGLNGMYVHHPAFKWMKQSIDAMEHTPENLNERFTSILTERNDRQLANLEKIIEEVFDLVEVRMPHLSLADARKRAGFARPEHQLENKEG